MMEVSAWLDEHWKLWLGHLIGKPGVRMLEIGSYEGASASWFMKNILTHPDSGIICIDTWEGGEGLIEYKDDGLYQKFCETMKQWRGRYSAHKGKSQDILPPMSCTCSGGYERCEYDAAYIDGSHTAANVLSDSVDVFRLMKQGGIIIWDDYLWDVWNDPLRQPKMAIDAFLACYKGQYEQIAEGWQVVIKKL